MLKQKQKSWSYLLYIQPSEIPSWFCDKGTRVTRKSVLVVQSLSLNSTWFFRRVNQSHGRGRYFKVWQMWLSSNPQGSLKVHIQLQHENIKYNCPDCDKVYTNRASMVIHKRNDHEQRKLKCEFCDKSYGLANSLRVHVKAVHKQKTFKWQVCKFESIYASTLREHV